MRVKYLLAAMAAPLFFSCTQDEFVGQNEGQDAAALQNRVKVGKVAFVNEGEADTRFDYWKATWENGDMFRLFLMDQWNANGNWKGGEEANANKTHFMKQDVWNEMYTIVNNFATNIPFYFNGETKAWENDDAIVEGNYFAVAPAKGNQTKILNGVKNRRDAWVYINPVQKFDVSQLKESNGAKGAMMDGVEENQFFLGYSQVYRNEQMVTEENTLQLPMQMRPVLANIDLAIANYDELPFKVEKIVMSRLDGSPMPTLAYIRPAGNTPKDFGRRQDNSDAYFMQQWAKMATDANIAKFNARYPELCLGHSFEGTAAWQPKEYWANYPAFAQPFIVDSYTDACGVDHEDPYWTIASWTRTAARSVVEYSYPGQKGFTPYGCTGEIAEPAYEYVFDFTNEDGEGFRLNNGDSFRAFLSLPHDMYLREYTFTVYGQQYDPARDRWDEGIIIPKKSDYVDGITDGEENDGKFTLLKVDPSSEADYLQANIYFDDFRITRSRVVQTANAGDLMNHLESYYGKMGNFNQDVNKNELFYVETMGDFEITNELVDYVQALYDRYDITGGSKSLIYFTRTTGADGHGQLVFPANLKNDHAFDLFYYSKDVDVLNLGNQVIEKPIIYNYNKSNEVLFEALRQSNWYKSIFNDGVDLLDKFEPALTDQLFGGIGHITNEGTLTVKTLIDASEYGFAIHNTEAGTLNLEKAAIVSGEDYTDLVTVHNEGQMNMVKSFIQGVLDNAGVVDVKDGYSFVTKRVINNNDCIGCPTGDAKLNVWKGATFYAPIVANGIRANDNGVQVGKGSRGEILVEGQASFGGWNAGRIVVKGVLVPQVNGDDLDPQILGNKNDLVNMTDGVIEVRDGDLKYIVSSVYESGKIINKGIIYSIGKAHVIINRGAGIIDVTLADKTGGYEARAIQENTYFRFCGAVTEATLKKVISENNWNNKHNPIILQYPAIKEDLTETPGEYTQEELPMNVTKILVKAGSTLNLNGTWGLKDYEGDPEDVEDGIGNDYNGLKVDGNLFVLNEKTLTQTNSINAVVNGKMRGENSSKILTGEDATVVVDGSGVFEYAGIKGGCTWEKGSIPYFTVLYK